MPITETRETFVSIANDPLFGTVITIGDEKRNIAIIGDVGTSARKCFCLLITFTNSGRRNFLNDCFLGQNVLTWVNHSTLKSQW